MHMSSAFLSRYAESRISPPSHFLPHDNYPKDLTENQEELLTLVRILKPPFIEQQLSAALDYLRASEFNVEGPTGPSFDNLNNTNVVLRKAVAGRIVLGIYANALDVYLSEASTAENDAEWWADITRSWTSVALYLIQTLPGRLLSVLQIIKTNNVPLRLSSFYPSSLHHLFPSRSALLPHPLIVTLFPHLNTQHEPLVPATSRFLSSALQARRDHTSDFIKDAYHLIILCSQEVVSFLGLPLRWTRQECQLKRKELEKIRDERAEVLGRLVELRPQLSPILEENYGSSTSGPSRVDDTLASFVDALGLATSDDASSLSVVNGAQNTIAKLCLIRDEIFISHRKLHSECLNNQRLLRPSRLTLLWPRLLLLPPLVLYGVRSLYASRASISELAEDTVETIQGFTKDWLLEPIKGVVKTIKAGGEEGVIVRKEAVAADLASLERMTLALAQDTLRYDAEQLATLSRQIRLGDLTTVLRIYEDDIKTPVKSAIAGTLLRSMFVQVQKAKVDIDQALTGIDKLLKSQELTFAFVGVAPAFAVVYVLGGFLKNVWLGGRGRGRYGGKQRRAGVWLAMRRIERLLVFQPKSTSQRSRRGQTEDRDDTMALPPLTSGLLVLSVTHLRKYAESSLPARSRLREGFLEDVRDLEDPTLGRGEKLRVVDRMWKSWGEELGWSRLG